MGGVGYIIIVPLTIRVPALTREKRKVANARRGKFTRMVCLVSHDPGAPGGNIHEALLFAPIHIYSSLTA
jgi:hypothetical protein